MKQQTLASGFKLSGVGLHTGVKTHVRVLPAQPDEGRYFVRVDLTGEPVIPARVDHVVSTTLSTELETSDFGLPLAKRRATGGFLDFGLGSTRESLESSQTNEQSKNPKSKIQNPKSNVRTVEHLLAALAGSGVDNARIEIDGPELPLLDGSAKDWVEAIATTGVAIQEASDSREAPQVSTPVWIYQGDAFVAALPSPVTRFTYGIDFDNPSIGNQWHSWSPGKESFATEIASARTFALAHQIDQLREAGLIKGGSLDNALVCGAQGWLNPPLRFSNEPVRHKLLDLVGDLSLLGTIPVAHFLAYKASHKLHVQLALQLAQSI